MTTKIDFKLVAIVFGGMLFNYIFWKENYALNLLLYAVFVVAVLFSDKTLPKNKSTIVTGALFLFSALMVVYNNSDLSLINYYVSLFVFVGCTHTQNLKTVVAAIIAAFVQYLTAPVTLFKRAINLRIGNFSLKPLLHILKYLVVPILVIVIFGFLYSNANSIFGEFVGDFFTTIGNLISRFFSLFFADYSFQRFMHLVFGIVFTAGIFLSYKHTALEQLEKAQFSQLVRKRKPLSQTSIGRELMSTFMGDLIRRKMALKTENIIGVISFAVLNLLILSLNAIDLSTLWLANGLKANLNYSAELHNGTDTLILSIVLAMLVILFFFNGNLNFYSKNKTIKTLAYIWIFQNLFLILTVLHRDYDYMAAHGLTYKRIGVIVFSVLCIVGLTSVYIKVAQQKTFFYLLRVNTLIWFGLLVISTVVNWDVFIVSYNVHHRKTIALDYDHLTNMSDKTLPLLHQNRGLLTAYLKNDGNNSRNTNAVDKVYTNAYLVKTMLQNKVEGFNKRKENATFLSWNYRDWQTDQYFRKHNKYPATKM